MKIRPKNVRARLEAFASSPVSAGIAAAMTFVLIVIVVFGAIGGSYALEDHYYHVQAAQTQANLRLETARAKRAQIKASIPICVALRDLAEVKGARVVNGASYGVHLERAFTQLYVTTGCPKILRSQGLRS